MASSPPENAQLELRLKPVALTAWRKRLGRSRSWAWTMRERGLIKCVERQGSVYVEDDSKFWNHR